MDVKPIPAFYCCYLLRSTIRHSSLYVGSSPDPARRLAQHNGRVQGGAVRTSRASLRPWEMTCIVAGFPSNIAALQFEWAWHNAHLTRHITATERITFATTRTKTSRSGKTTRRPGRPRTSLMDKLSNLHLLLRTPYFSKWPLELRFFNEEVYRSWMTWCGRVDTYLRSGIRVHFDPPQAKPPTEEFTSAQPSSRRSKADLIGKGGVEGVDPTYARLYDVLQKSQFLLDEDDTHKCSVCAEPLDIHRSLFAICPSNQCYDVSHITCIAEQSLGGNDSDDMVPEHGVCPSCKQTHPWSELMQQVTVRTRGEKEARKLLSKKARSRAATAAAILEAESEEDEEEDEAMDYDALTAQDVVDEEGDLSDDDQDNASVASADSIFSRESKMDFECSQTNKPSKFEIVIEDSEDEE